MDRKTAVHALSAIAQDQRLQIFRLLVNSEPQGLLAGEIAVAIGALPNTVSSNLSKLGAAHLISSVREGRSIRYRAEIGTMGELISFLTDDCCGSRPEVCCFGNPNEVNC